MRVALKKKFNSYFSQTSSLRNVLTLVGGTALAQAIPLLISPIISRVYSPEDFGVFTLYLSISQVLISLANGRYELAIMLPKKESHAINIFFLCIIITVSLSLLTFIIISLGYQSFSYLINNDNTSPWLFLVPLTILGSGIFNAFNYYFTRNKKYALISRSNISKGGASGIIQVALGGIGATNGLILGHIASSFLGNILYIKNLVHKRLYRLFNWKILKRQAIIHSDFPKYSVWGIFLNTFSQNFINFFISSFYSTTILGYYSYGFRYLSIPAGLLGNSFGQVYMQEIAESRQQKGRADDIFIVTLKKLIVITLPLFLIAFLFIEDLFIIVFGETWQEAGHYAQIMLPLIFIRLIAAPLSITVNVFEKQKFSLFIHSILFLLIGSVALFTFFSKLKIESFLILQTTTLSLFYLFVILGNFQVSKGNR